MPYASPFETKLRVFVQARMTSRRLPGKVLFPLVGTPVILHVLRRAAEVVSKENVVLLTSSLSSDDSLANTAENDGFAVFRGALEDVLDRFLKCARNQKAEWIVRLSGDSPLLDVSIIRLLIAEVGDAYDLITNVHPRTFPKGQSVEVIRVGALEKLALETNDPDDREHVTRGFYRRPREYNIKNVPNPLGDQSAMSDVLDTPEDWLKIQERFGTHTQ